MSERGSFPPWLKIGMAVAVICVGLLDFAIWRSRVDAGQESAALDQIAADYCAAKADIVAAIEDVQASDLGNVEDQAAASLRRIAVDVQRIRDAARAATDAGLVDLGGDLAALASELQDVHDALAGLDRSALDRAVGRLVATVPAIDASPSIHARCS